MEGVENIRIIILLQEISQGRKSFVFKVVLSIRREKNAVEVADDDGEGVVGRRRRQVWPQGIGHQAATKWFVIAGGQVDMDEGQVTYLKMLEVTWLQVGRRGCQRPSHQADQLPTSRSVRGLANEGIISQGSGQWPQPIVGQGAFL